MVILPRVPYPLEKGDKLRAFHLLRHLSRKHDIILCALNDTPLHPDAIKILSGYFSAVHVFPLSRWSIAINLLKAFWNGIPFQAGYFYRSRVAGEIKRLIDFYRPDHLFCQLLRVAEYVKDVQIPKTIDYQDVFSKGVERRISTSPFYLRPLLRMEHRRLLKYEYRVFEMFDHKVIISRPDRDLIPHPDRDQIHIIPNGVDTEYFQPMEMKKEYDLVFTGNMGYPPNVDAAEYLAREILPIVRHRFPRVCLLIAGANPSPRVLRLAGDFVKVTGWVDDIRKCYASAKIFIAPMRIGTGLQNKLLEAMAMRLPCITSPLAYGALNANDGEHLLIADSADKHADLICRLLDEPDWAEQIASNGYQFVHEHYHWETMAEKLNQIITSNQ